MTTAPIRTDRLELVSLGRRWLELLAGREPLPDLGFSDPHRFLTESDRVVHMRIEQLAQDPTEEPWLLRAMVVRNTMEAVGYVNFHAPPDERGMVEIGYRVVPSKRRHGYATEAAEAMWQWAAEQGARVLRASVAPDNVASLAMIGHAGFQLVGEQIDEVDGLELLFERPVPD